MVSVRLYASFLLGALAAGAFAGCDQAASAPPPSVAVDPEIEALEQAARWPNREVGILVNLQNVYAAKGLHRRGHDFFSELSRREPGDGVLLALVGVFAARVALEEPLVQRVDWVEDAISTLDEAVAIDDNLPRFFRAVTLARLPDRFDAADEAIDELEFLLRNETSFIFTADEVGEQTRQGLLRQGWQAVALAAQTAGDKARADEAWALAGSSPVSGNVPLIGTNYAVDGTDGFRFSQPLIWSPREWVHVAQGYDFGDIAFVETEEGLVLIDAGTQPENAAAALADVRALGVTGPVHTVILTHAHWDHIGGLAGVLEPGTRTIGQAKFAEELEIVNSSGVEYQWFFGERTRREEPYGPFYDVTPDRLIDTRTDITIGGVDFVLHPVSGGETEDALLIEIPQEGILFVGDAFMPYVGAPFVGEGTADGLIDTTEYIVGLQPNLLIHGHPPLTENWTAEVMEPFAASLRELRDHTTRGIIDGRSVAEIVRDAKLPALLQDHPHAVVPVFVVMEQFIQRLHRSRTGYWQPTGEGLALIAEDEWAVAMDMLAGAEEERWVAAISGLISRGDLRLAWRFARRGLLVHPQSIVLEALRVRALDGLRAKYQQYNPFKFIVFSELAGKSTRSLPCRGPEC